MESTSVRQRDGEAMTRCKSEIACGHLKGCGGIQGVD
jgi:hypothetical protein